MPGPVGARHSQYRISNPADVAPSQRAAQRLAGEVGFPDLEQAEIGLAMRELATNMLRHADHGVITLFSSPDAIWIEARDLGPGIPNIEQAVADGYSTAGSLGYGLGSVNRSMDEMTIKSAPGKGTTVTASRRVRQVLPNAGRSQLDIGAATTPKPGYLDNGDTYVIKTWGQHALVGVIDGLGHGKPAQVAALAARRYVMNHFDQPLDAVFAGAGTACRGTRGVVMALAHFDWGTGTLAYASVGNIEARVFDVATPENFIVRRGVVGLNAPAAKVTSRPWSPKATLVLFSDGIRGHWTAGDFPEWTQASASVLAAAMLNKLNRGTDDATVLIVKPSRQ